MKLSDYFNSYKNVNPLWVERRDIHKKMTGHDLEPGYSPAELVMMPNYIPLTQNDYPKLFQVMKEESNYRGVPMPACYVNTNKQEHWAWAQFDRYAVVFNKKIIDSCTSEELRWPAAHELKHLYQYYPENSAQSRENEKDCDRAGVQSAGYEASRSFFSKIARQVLENIPIKPFRTLALRFHDAYPNFLVEHVPVQLDWTKTDFGQLKIILDENHPSPRQRLKAMREWENILASREISRFIATFAAGGSEG